MHPLGYGLVLASIKQVDVKQFIVNAKCVLALMLIMFSPTHKLCPFTSNSTEIQFQVAL